MHERNQYEENAVVHAGVAAGEYVERVGRTDMATWSEDEWNGFVSFVCAEYVNGLMVQWDELGKAVERVASPS
jgi:hypothetical protein